MKKIIKNIKMYMYKKNKRPGKKDKLEFLNDNYSTWNYKQ